MKAGDKHPDRRSHTRLTTAAANDGPELGDTLLGRLAAAGNRREGAALVSVELDAKSGLERRLKAIINSGHYCEGGDMVRAPI